MLEIKEKVSSNAEAKTLAEKRLREKNGQQFTASFTLVGDAGLVAGVTVTVKGHGAFDGKYIVESATHSVSSSGYTTSVKLRRVLEGYCWEKQAFIKTSFARAGFPPSMPQTEPPA